jgi:hypothetical protein
LALEALVKNFDKKDNKTIEHVLHQIGKLLTGKIKA